MSYKHLASLMPPLIADVEAALTTTISSPSNYSALESRAETLFETGNMKMLAQPGITDGSPLSSAAEVVAGTTRLLVRVCLRELLKGAKNGDGGKVRTEGAKAQALCAKLHTQVSDLQNA